VPANASKVFSGMTMLEAAEHAAAEGIAPIEAKTAENILFNLSSFFRWAVREHIIERSPAEGLQPLQRKRSKDEGRQPFVDADLRALFSADLYRTPYQQVNPQQLGRYWVPLLALYHGARMNELCQLEVADIRVLLKRQFVMRARRHAKRRNPKIALFTLRSGWQYLP
jgi:integrase